VGQQLAGINLIDHHRKDPPGKLTVIQVRVVKAVAFNIRDLGNLFRIALLLIVAGVLYRFDTYLVDEVTAVGDAAFRRKSRAVFAERMKTSGAILVSHEMNQVRQFCDAGIVLEDGQLHYFDDLEEAIALHRRLMQ
jgi:ABC-type polysaccharide/polyol phosphate transport system ATPase subunit